MEKVLPHKVLFPRRQATFIGVFLIVVLMFVTTYCMGVVRGASMEPTYQDGQVVLVRRHTILNPTLHRNDVVLLQRDRGEVIIKRIYRLPGEEVLPGYPFLIGKGQSQGLSDYYEQETLKTRRVVSTRFFVPHGYIAVLGDNPDVSEDSRFFGPVRISDVLGVVVDAPPPPANLSDRSPAPGVSRDPLQGTP
jgi:signal peptidase I